MVSGRRLKKWVICIPVHRIRSVEGEPVIPVQRRVELEPPRQVGVGDEEATISYQIRVALRHHFVAFLTVVSAGSDEGSLESSPHRQKPVGDLAPAFHNGHPRFHHMAVEKAVLVELVDEVEPQSLRVGVPATEVVCKGRQAYPHSLSSYLVDDGLHHLQSKPAALLQAPTVLVRPVVDAIFQELVDEVPMRSVDLHSVETCSMHRRQ